MKARRFWEVGTVLVLLVSLLAMGGWGQGVAPKGIIPTPPESTALQVSIWVDRGAYAVGESITIHYSVNQAAYIYIWDITPDGQANQIFPNTFPGGSSNYVTPGEHTVPGNWSVTTPLGTEYLQILATTSPVNPFSYFSPDPESFRAQVEVQILGILPVSARSWNFTSFEIASGTVPTYGTLDVRSVPAGATISVDGTYAGYTPRLVFVGQGFRQVTISKSGYRTWQGTYFIIGGPTRTLSVTLTALTPQNQSPVPAFSFAPNTPSVGEWVQFDGSTSYDSDGTITSFAWTFGDGAGGAGSSIWHRYSAGGSYAATLTVTDNAGMSSSPVSHVIQVGSANQQPVALLTADPSATVVGGWIQFNASTSYDPDGSIASYAWAFGDGTSASGASVWHRFNSAGTFTVTLTVTDDGGAQDVEARSVQIGSSNNQPTATFSYTPVSASVLEWVHFDASASSDPDGTVASFQWAFGDGSPTATGSSVYHQFSAAGTYSVTLVVTDNDGATNAQTRQIQVGTSAQSPVASFTSSPTSPAPGQTITLDASSSYDPDGAIVSYRWDLNGDGTTDASGSVAQVRYSNAGTATVRLTVTDNSGLQNAATKTIVIAVTGPVSSGAPAMGTTPGFFVWGTDTWHITVNAGAGWTAPRAYRIELRTNGIFSSVNQGSSSGVSALGLVPTPTTGGNSLLFEGSLQTGSVDYTFTAPGATSIWMSLKMDTNGSGSLVTSPAFTYLRASMVRPNTSPFVVGLPQGYSGTLIPSINFRIGIPMVYPTLILWGPTISELGG